MKKIVSLVLMLTMLLSITAVSASADGSLYFRSDFTSEEITNAQFMLGEFYVEPVDGILCGYSGARALQARYDDENPADNPYGYVTYDASVEMAFAEDELVDGERWATVVYCNTNLINVGLSETTYYMNFNYSIDKGEFYLTGGAVGFNADDILAGPFARELASDGSEYYTFGMSVSKNRVRCFLDGELIFDYNDTTGEKLIGAENRAQLVVWNDNNFMTIKDIKVASDGYLYPLEMTPDPVVTSDDSAVSTDKTDNTGVSTSINTLPDESTTASEATTRVESSVVVKEDGETEIVTEIITESAAPAPADTNTGKPSGGSSTATGDSTFVVVAAMVATLGCALIVRKVNVR